MKTYNSFLKNMNKSLVRLCNFMRGFGAAVRIRGAAVLRGGILKLFSLLLSAAVVCFPPGCAGDGGEVNQPPVANDMSVNIFENEAAEITLNAVDRNCDLLSYSIDSDPEHGSLSGSAPNIIYTPLSGYTGRDSFTFTASDGVSESGAAEVSIGVIPCAKIPPSPLNLMASPVSATQIALSWEDNSNNEEGFRIERRAGAEGSFALVQETGSDAIAYTDCGLTEGAVYYYRVYAFKTTGNSDYSNEVSESPRYSFFVYFTVSPGPHIAQISFNTREEASVKIEYGDTASYGSETVADSGGTEHVFVVSGLEKNTAYHYRAVAEDIPDAGIGFHRVLKTDDYYVVNAYADTYEFALSGSGCDGGLGTGSGGFSDPNHAINGVRGCGWGCGSFDIMSTNICYPHETESYFTLSWSDRFVQNGPGTDFVVFENGFGIYAPDGGFSSNHWMAVVIVYLSRDGIDWIAFPHDYVHEPETESSTYPPDWQGFGGCWPVKLNEDTNPVDPFVWEDAGGDQFDLDELEKIVNSEVNYEPSDEEKELANLIMRRGFRYWKFSLASYEINPDTGDCYHNAGDGSPDIDGVYARYFVDD